MYTFSLQFICIDYVIYYHVNSILFAVQFILCWIKYNKWLQEKIEEIKPLCVVVEQPFFRGKSSDY